MKDNFYAVILTKEQRDKMLTLLRNQEGFEDIFTEIDLAETLDQLIGDC